MTTLYGFVVRAETPLPNTSPVPIPYAPIEAVPNDPAQIPAIQITALATADADGWFSISVPQEEDIILRSGNKALEFVSINSQETAQVTGVGSTLSTQNPFEIKAVSRIMPGPLCRDVQDGQAVLRFPYTFRSEEPVTVPAGASNYLLSVSGTPLPTEEFQPSSPSQAANTNYFSRNLPDFIAPDGSIAAEWYIFGYLAPKTDPIPLCEGAAGTPGDCSNVTLDLGNVFRYVTDTAGEVSKVIVAHKRNISFTGRTRIVYYRRQVTKSLRELRGLLQSVPKTVFTCANTPQNCSTRRVPKKEIVNTLDSLFTTKWPKEIKPIVKFINKLAPPSRRKLLKMLDNYPDSVTTCDQQ
jgi:hypothetical protein